MLEMRSLFAALALMLVPVTAFAAQEVAFVELYDPV